MSKRAYAYEPYEGSGNIRGGSDYSRYQKRRAVAEDNTAMIMAMPNNTTQYHRQVAPLPRVMYVARTPGGQVNSERKYFDTRCATLAVQITNASFAGAEADPNVGGGNCLFSPTQGNDISNREGRSCYVHKITIQGVIEVNAQTGQAAVDQTQTCRLILCMDKQTNGTQMNSEDLIESTGGVPGTFQFQNTKNFGRFQVLRDKFVNFSQFTIAANGSGQVFQGGQSKYFKLKYQFKTPIRVNFNATNGGTVADIVDNSFHLLAGRDNADSPVSLDYQCRVSFTG